MPLNPVRGSEKENLKINIHSIGRAKVSGNRNHNNNSSTVVVDLAIVPGIQ
jgi:hypothetical protein